MMKIAFVLTVMALLLSTSTLVEPSSIRALLSDPLAQVDGAEQRPPSPYVKCKKNQECCVIGSNPKTECFLCAAVCP